MRAVYAKVAHLMLQQTTALIQTGSVGVDQTPVEYEGQACMIESEQALRTAAAGGCSGTDFRWGPHEINRRWHFLLHQTNPSFQPSPTGQATTIRDRRCTAPYK
jgi:hypothetical protein